MPLASLPDSQWLVIGAVVLALFAIAGVGLLLDFARKLRANLAAELRRELTQGQEASPITVQQPLVVTPHQEAVTREELAKVDLQLHGRIKRERAEIDAQIARVEATAQRRSELLEAKIDENTKVTVGMGGEVRQINQTVTQLTQALMAFLRDQAK